MAERVLGIEIGPKLTKVVETEYKTKALKLYGFFTFETPEEMMNDGDVTENEQFRDLLEQGLKEHKIKTRKVVFSIQSSKIGTKEEELPVMKENKLKEYLQTDIKAYFPVDPEQYQIIFRNNGEGANGKNRYQLFAVPQEMVESYERLAAFCNLQVVDIELTDNGIAKVVEMYRIPAIVALVTVEARTTTITIADHGNITMQRSVPYGIEESIVSVKDSNFFGENLNFLDTVKNMHGTSCFAERLYSDDEEVDEVKADATDNAKYVIGNVNRILDYYIAQKHIENLDKVFLSGLAPWCEGFTTLFANEINRPVEVISHELATGERPLAEDVSAIYFGGIACALQPSGVTLSKKRGAISLNDFEKSDDPIFAKKIFLVCVIGAILLAGVPTGMRIYLNMEKNSVQKDIDAMQDAKDAYEKYQMTQAQYDELISVCDMTNTPDDALLSLYSEMEANIPSEAYVTSMSASAEGVVIDFTTTTKATAAQTIKAFRSFDTVQSISTSGITVDTDDAGVQKVSFTITCYYLDSVATDDATQESAE